MLYLLACFSLSSFKNWISSLVPSFGKLFFISFNVLLSSPSTYSMLSFFLIFFCDSRSGTKRFRLVLDVSSFTLGELDELVSLTGTIRQIVSRYVWTSLVFYGTWFYCLSTSTTVHCYYILH